jgi:ABC-type nitrate/sulfonate/bicarbonate transport system ATPase subunit
MLASPWREALLLPALAAQGVFKTYRIAGQELPTLAGVDVTAAAGEFVGLIGPSGCGKSTLLRILAGLEEPDRGQVRFDVAPRLGAIGLMPQRDALLPWRTLLDNVALGLELGAHMARHDARGKAREQLAAFGLDGFAAAYPGALSGGMRQRGALLRTFLAGKPATLLDEPLGALDSLTRAEVQEWLEAAWLRFQPTVVLVTHDVDEAIFLCDRIYVLSARPGRVTAEVAVTLPRPRPQGARTSEPFVRLKERLLTELGGRG